MGDGITSILLPGPEWEGGGGIVGIRPNQKSGNSFSLPAFIGEIIGIFPRGPWENWADWFYSGW